MNYIPRMNRRSFVVSAAAVGGGLALGFDIPVGGPQVIRAKDGSPNAASRGVTFSDGRQVFTASEQTPVPK